MSRYNTEDGSLYVPSRVGLVQLFNQYHKIASRDIHTQIPAKVLEVDYDKGFVTVQPLIRTVLELNGGLETELLPVDEVPIMMVSSKRGKARLSTPVTVGDVGLLFFSERATGTYLNSSGDKIVDSKEYAGVGFEGVLPPIGFFPEIFTASANRKIRSDATVLEDGVASIALKESGEITTKNKKSTIVQSANGDYSLSNSNCQVTATDSGVVTVNAATSIDLVCGSSSISMSPSGVVTINGTTFTIGGYVATTSMVASTSLSVAGKEMDQHTHSEGSYQAGSIEITGNSGAPV